MKIKKGLNFFSVLVLLSIMGWNSSCSSREEVVNCFPQYSINVQLNLNLPAYATKLDSANWMYINEQQSGTRGLILVRAGVYPNYRFKIYDRNAPHICPDENTTLEVQGGVKIICPKDSAEWILSTGEPIKIAGIPPKVYNYSYNPATGIISIYY